MKLDRFASQVQQCLYQDHCIELEEEKISIHYGILIAHVWEESCKLCSAVELTEQLDCKSMEIKWYKYMKVDP